MGGAAPERSRNSLPPPEARSTKNAASELSRTRRFSAGPPASAALPLGFYNRPAEQVARDLLGAWLISEVGGERCAGEIVETEAYIGPHDEASHAAARVGRTPRNAVMFGPPGLAYVYRIYGIHWCLNAVAGPEGYPAAVLIRAGRPAEGIEVARARRPGRVDAELMRGPGNLARALGVEGQLTGHPLDRAPLWIVAAAPVADEQVERGPRIGVTRAADWPLRFWIRGSPYVSR